LGELDNDLFKEIFDRFDGIHENSSWKIFIQTLCVDMGSKFPLGTVPNNSSESPRVLSLLLTLKEALINTYRADWMYEEDYMSPGCLLHLVEHLLMLASSFQGYFITSKSVYLPRGRYQPRFHFSG
jgi:hypothetical protein